MASLSSPSTAVQQAEQKAEHASSLRHFQQAVQEPLPTQEVASPSRGQKVSTAASSTNLVESNLITSTCAYNAHQLWCFPITHPPTDHSVAVFMSA